MSYGVVCYFTTKRRAHRKENAHLHADGGLINELRDADVDGDRRDDHRHAEVVAAHIHEEGDLYTRRETER